MARLHYVASVYCHFYVVVVVVNDEMDADTTCLYVHISNVTFY